MVAKRLCLPLPPVGRIDKREEIMTRTYTRETRFLSSHATSEKGLHGLLSPKVHFVQELAIDLAQFRVMLLTVLKGSLSVLPAGPLLTIPQAPYPPIVQTPAFGLHELKSSSILF